MKSVGVATSALLDSVGLCSVELRVMVGLPSVGYQVSGGLAEVFMNQEDLDQQVFHLQVRIVSTRNSFTDRCAVGVRQTEHVRMQQVAKIWVAQMNDVQQSMKVTQTL